MKSLLEKFKKMSLSRKIQCIVAVVLTICLPIAISVYAWFIGQKKAAELYKVEYPNSLYINAAHREDKMYFRLDSIDVNEYLRDDENNIVKDQYGNPIYINQKNYIFAVSGSNTDKFILQMAHTNNNLFNYKIYEATQYDNLPANFSSDKIIEYKTNPGGYTENPLVFASDPVNRESSETKYYVIGNLTSGTYLNNQSGDDISEVNLAKNGDFFYSENYGSNTNVEDHAIPSYWKGEFETQNSNKLFCRYFILKVTWDYNVINTQKTKESDMIYFSVKRTE